MNLNDNDQQKLEMLYKKENLTAIELQQKEALIKRIKEHLDDKGKLIVDTLIID